MPQANSRKNTKMKKTKKIEPAELTEFERRIQKLSNEELKDLLLVNTYKLAMMRAQIEAVSEILIKNKIMTYEELWRRTNEIFKDDK